jgi:hypothetical protein
MLELMCGLCHTHPKDCCGSIANIAMASADSILTVKFALSIFYFLFCTLACPRSFPPQQTPCTKAAAFALEEFFSS